MDYLESDLSFTTKDSENKATDYSRAGKFGSGSEAELMDSGEVGVVSVGHSEGCPVGGSDERSEGGSVWGSYGGSS